jgi:hypothetical protein
MRSCVVALVVLLGVGFCLQLSAEDPSVRSNSEPSAQTDEQKAVVIDPADETGPTIKTDRMLTEEEAQELVWNLPEVQADITRILDQGGIPLSMVGFRPSPGTQPRAGKAFYTIHFQGIDVMTPVPERTFCVEAYAGRISIFDPSSGQLISLEDWRHQRK